MKIAPSITEGDVHLPAAWRVLAALLRRSPLTQADLRAATGLSHPVIVQQVTTLRWHDVIRCSEPRGGKPGRPCVPVAFNWGLRRVLTVDVHQAAITLQVLDLAGTPLGDRLVRPLPTWTPAGIASALHGAITHVLAQPGAPWGGIGIILPAGISADGSTMLTCAGMPGCAEDPLATTLSARFNLPVLLQSDGHALAQATWATGSQAVDSVMALTLRHTPHIGLGLVLQGAPVAGINRYADGLAQIRAKTSGRLMACGREACLQTLLTAAREDASLRPQVVHALGTVAAHLVSALAPEYLVLQGDDRWSDHDTSLFQSTLRDRGCPDVMQALTLTPRPATAADGLLGVGNLLIHRLLDFQHGAITGWISPEMV